jgi:hypothetical protein
MADKNIVDDYYSNINGDDKKNSQPVDNKIKIKPKRKLVVKKTPVKNTDTKQVDQTATPKSDIPFKPSKA